MTHASLFSGIGGFDLAAEWMGWENLFHCEWNPFCQKVLKYHFPNAHSYNDITTSDFTEFRGRVDVLTGGFPCQPFSTAGQRKGTADDRYLWPEMLRAIREVAPRYIVGENVDGIFTWNEGLVFETVCADLENEGYEVATYRIPACATGAPHRRDRWWFVAHAKRAKRWPFNTAGCRRDFGENHLSQWPESAGRFTSEVEHAANPTEQRLSQPRQTGKQQFPAQSEARLHHRPQFSGEHATHTGHTGPQRNELGRTLGQRTRPPRPIAERFENEHWIEAATRLCVLDDGLPGRLDAATLSTKPQHAAGKWRKESMKAAGNAIVPQVALAIFQAIESTMQ